MTLPKLPEHSKLWANIASAVITVMFIKTEWPVMAVDAMLAYAGIMLGYHGGMTYMQSRNDSVQKG